MVGYQQNEVPTGYAMITPCFENVGGGNYAIDNFQLINVEDTMASVQVVNEDGTWGTYGVWFNAYEDLPAGWFTDATGLIPADISLKPGEAVFFYTSASGAKAQSAGAVSGVITNSVASGYSMVGNASPVTISIDDIELLNVEDTMASVQVVNADGSWGTYGVWFNAYEDLPSGWFTDATGLEPAEITLTPGQSVFFYTSAADAKVLVPSAL